MTDMALPATLDETLRQMFEIDDNTVSFAVTAGGETVGRVRIDKALFEATLYQLVEAAVDKVLAERQS